MIQTMLKLKFGRGSKSAKGAPYLPADLDGGGKNPERPNCNGDMDSRDSE